MKLAVTSYLSSKAIKNEKRVNFMAYLFTFAVTRNCESDCLCKEAMNYRFREEIDRYWISARGKPLQWGD